MANSPGRKRRVAFHRVDISDLLPEGRTVEIDLSAFSTEAAQEAIQPGNHLREQLVLAVNGNPISADDAWAILHAWDRFTDPEWWLAEFERQQEAARA